MADNSSYRLTWVWKSRSLRANVPWSRVVESPVWELNTSVGKFELVWVAVSSKSKKKVKKDYKLKHEIQGHVTAKGEGWYGVIINVKKGTVLARGVLPLWLKSYIASYAKKYP